ncbi:hypothetical protein Tco_1228172 [Tanacetum coccineum]
MMCQTPRQIKRGQDTKIPQSSTPLKKVGDEAVHKELGNRIERAATTASSLEAEQDNENPKIYVSFIRQFWETATASTNADGKMELTASIDGQEKTITKVSLRRHLKLEDSDGLTSLLNTEIFEQLALIGYVSDSDRLTFQKGYFSPQWRFLIHTILHCLSPKKTAWEQFSSNIATAIICLATNRTFNFSKMIFDAMVKNLDSPYKFFMYLRFLQICFNKQRRLLGPHTRTYVAHTLTQKLFSNMKRTSKGYSGVDIPLFPTMITPLESSPSIITSSPSLSPQSHPSPQTHDAKEPAEPATMPMIHLNQSLENELKETKQTYNSALTKLIRRVKKLEQIVKASKSRRRARMVLTDDEGKSPTKPSGQIGSDEKVKISFSISTLLLTRNAEQLIRKEKQKIARDAEIAKQLQEEIDSARQEQEKAEANPAHGGYKLSHFKGMSYDDIRPIFERVWDQIYIFVPNDSKIEKEVMKRPGFDLQQKRAGGSRKKSLARKRAGEKQSEESTKRQKIEDDIEKEELKAYLDLVPR